MRRLQFDFNTRKQEEEEEKHSPVLRKLLDKIKAAEGQKSMFREQLQCGIGPCHSECSELWITSYLQNHSEAVCDKQQENRNFCLVIEASNSKPNTRTIGREEIGKNTHPYLVSKGKKYVH